MTRAAAAAAALAAAFAAAACESIPSVEVEVLEATAGDAVRGTPRDAVAPSPRRALRASPIAGAIVVVRPPDDDLDAVPDDAAIAEAGEPEMGSGRLLLEVPLRPARSD